MATMLAPRRLAGAGFPRQGMRGIEYRAPEPCSLSQRQVFDLAEEVNRALALDVGFDIGRVVGTLDGRLHTVTAYGIDDPDGSIFVHGVSDFDIYLPDDAGPRRNRFTVVHELGHYFLHFRPQEGFGLVAAREGTGRVEWEAHWFARAFLMPEDAFVQVHQDCQEVHMDIADAFQVSLKACEIRASDLGLRLR